MTEVGGSRRSASPPPAEKRTFCRWLGLAKVASPRSGAIERKLTFCYTVYEACQLFIALVQASRVW